MGTLPELVMITCLKCDGAGFFDPTDPDNATCGCMACNSTGEVEVCAGCGATPSVVNGVEWCHCLVTLSLGKAA